tara:strand:- start:188 stop:880 length:693 start_codon:yes stop_codon:yes gene_type:complete
MGRFNWQWAKVQAGQFIRFRYNGAVRVAIVMSSPRDSGARDKNLLHCLEIQNDGNPVEGMSMQMERILKRAGGVVHLFSRPRTGKFFKLAIGYTAVDAKTPTILYSAIKGIVKSKDLYKTYSWKKCKESAVYLDNDELNERNIPTEYLSKAGVSASDKLPPSAPKPKTFKKKIKPPRYKDGEVWVQPSGKWAGKNLEGRIRSYKDRRSAEIWAEGPKPKKPISFRKGLPR